MAKILVVDDEKSIRDLIRDVLKSDEREIEVSGYGLDAVELVCNNKFDIVITDIGLPDISGFEVMEKIWQINPMQAFLS